MNIYIISKYNIAKIIILLLLLLLYSSPVMSNSVTPWSVACQASLSLTIFQSLLKFMSITKWTKCYLHFHNKTLGLQLIKINAKKKKHWGKIISNRISWNRDNSNNRNSYKLLIAGFTNITSFNPPTILLDIYLSTSSHEQTDS